MASINKQTCPTCGHSVNQRSVRLGKHHVQGMLKVALWLKKNNSNVATMKQIRDVLTRVQYATFNEWRRFEPDMVFGKRGTYEFDMQRVRQIFMGERLCIEYHVDPLKPYIDRVEFGTLKDAKGVQEFLDDNQQFVAEYVGRVEMAQGSLL